MNKYLEKVANSILRKFTRLGYSPEEAKNMESRIFSRYTGASFAGTNDHIVGKLTKSPEDASDFIKLQEIKQKNLAKKVTNKQWYHEE